MFADSGRADGANANSLWPPQDLPALVIPEPKVKVIMRPIWTEHKAKLIELFYFLGMGWLGRALHAQQDMGIVQRWWGRTDYEEVRDMSNSERLHAFMIRFKAELGYKSVKNWPIYERQGGGKTMYHMIHATDHPKAPGLMRRAYHNAVRPKEPESQLEMEFGPLAAQSD